MLKTRTMLKILWSAVWILIAIWWNVQAQVMNQPTRASILNSDWDINGDWTFTDVCINVKERGAVGNDSTDDTAALQAVFTELADDPDGKPHCVLFPEGIYKITSALVLPTVQHKMIKGVSRSGSVIKQYTSNTPVIKTTDNNTHTIAIRDLSLEYNAAQGAGDTDSYALQFTATGTGGGFYYWSVDNVGIKNAYIGLGIDSADTGQIPLWGSSFTNMKFEVIKHNLARFVSPTAVGMPNLYLAGWEVVNTGVTTDSYAIHAAAANVTINGMEISQWDDEAFSFTGGRPTVINGLHMDAHQFLTDTEKIFSFGDNGPVFISGVTIATTINLPAGNGNVFHMVNSAAIATITGVQVNATLTDGTVTLASGDADADLTILDAALTNVTGGERFEHSDIISSQTETVTSPPHIYEDSILIGPDAHSSAFNNGWVGVYMRDSVNWTAVDAALPSGEAVQLVSATIEVTGNSSDDPAQDAMAINSLVQANPSGGGYQKAARSAFFQAQRTGDGDVETLEGIAVRVADSGSAGDIDFATGIRIAPTTETGDSILQNNGMTIQAQAAGRNSNIGLQIDEATGGSVENIGIWTKSNLSRFGPNRDEDITFQFDLLAGANEEIKWDEAADRFEFSHHAAILGNLFVESARDLPNDSCTLGEMVLDTAGANKEFCICQPANTWNCVTVTAGNPD